MDKGDYILLILLVKGLFVRLNLFEQITMMMSIKHIVCLNVIVQMVIRIGDIDVIFTESPPSPPLGGRAFPFLGGVSSYFPASYSVKYYIL